MSVSWGGPDKELGLFALAVGVLRGGEAAGRIGHLAHYIVQNLLCNGSEEGLAGHLPGVQVHPRQLGVVVEHLHPLPVGIGVFTLQGIGQVDGSEASGQVLFVQALDGPQMVLERCDEAFGQHRHPVFFPLAVADDDRPLRSWFHRLFHLQQACLLQFPLYNILTWRDRVFRKKTRAGLLCGRFPQMQLWEQDGKILCKVPK